MRAKRKTHGKLAQIARDLSDSARRYDFASRAIEGRTCATADHL